MWDPLLDEIFDGTLDGDAEYVVEKVQEALNAGLDPLTILSRSLIAAMVEVGDLYKEGEYREEELYVAAQAMQAGLAALKPALVGIAPQVLEALFTCCGETADRSLGRELALAVARRAGVGARHRSVAPVPPVVSDVVHWLDVDAIPSRH
ncbi:MAG: B12-binding domain-containing protein [Caldilineales bacterium]|nr:B12-binding domain-containing protein [Caldilineales bacterium]MDW8317536.1 B12-binding domain-containing protein [Anaerolineae bacterium]